MFTVASVVCCVKCEQVKAVLLQKCQVNVFLFGSEEDVSQGPVLL